MERRPVVVLLYLAAVTAYRRPDYCQLSCGGDLHTMCRFPLGGTGSCRSYRRGLSKDERRLILTLHNQLRQKVATGQERRRKQPPAADMEELLWDEEIAQVAQRWADQCDNLGHDHCRITADGAMVGQNLMSGWMVGSGLDGQANLTKWITGWYDEVKYLSPRRVANFRISGNYQEIGHYTQMVWAHTKRVGCGLADVTDRRGTYRYKFVCNYMPAGNVDTFPVYHQGNPCSKCPSGTSCSPRYPGLCAQRNGHKRNV